jgi:hypothetical protein
MIFIATIARDDYYFYSRLELFSFSISFFCFMRIKWTIKLEAESVNLK